MKVIVAGSRGIEDAEVVYRTIEESPFEITEVVSGTARGPDTLGENWAMAHNLPVKRIPAQWDTHGKKAGPIRNSTMAEYADALVAVWDGESRGTKNMIKEAQSKGLPVHLVETNQDTYQLNLDF